MNINKWHKLYRVATRIHIYDVCIDVLMCDMFAINFFFYLTLEQDIKIIPFDKRLKKNSW